MEESVFNLHQRISLSTSDEVLRLRIDKVQDLIACVFSLVGGYGPIVMVRCRRRVRLHRMNVERRFDPRQRIPLTISDEPRRLGIDKAQDQITCVFGLVGGNGLMITVQWRGRDR